MKKNLNIKICTSTWVSVVQNWQTGKLLTPATACGRSHYFLWLLFFLHSFIYLRGFALILKLRSPSVGLCSFQWGLTYCWPSHQWVWTKGKCRGKRREKEKENVKVKVQGQCECVSCRCCDREVFIFLCLSCSHTRPHWRVGALQRLKVKNPFVALLAWKKKKYLGQMKETFFIFTQSLGRRRLRC